MVHNDINNIFLYLYLNILILQWKYMYVGISRYKNTYKIRFE